MCPINKALPRLCTQLENCCQGGEAWPLTLVRDGSNFLPLLVKITTSESSAAAKTTIYFPKLRVLVQHIKGV